nr:bifunctional diaminohydroxyphosphoribosylaminopyrimidine deaminase/5-amino-6-(5-phosphoribosylamino)uracil reductase RibD [Candidatus Kapabacteria bacterium]
MTTELEAMKLALKLAQKGSGYVSPNPRVGAVLLKDGKIIGQGWHAKYGEAHAEVTAINNASDIDLTGATMVVTLEPCSHYGKTPPCAELIITKKISRVVIGMKDPHTKVAGRGIEMLEKAGIEVVVGLLEEECKWINRFFIKHINSGIPYIVAKVAQSLDACVAAANGQSKWITCDESRREVHSMRAELDAVLIGKGTAEADQPSLTVRDVEGRNPQRIIFDSKLSLSLSCSVFSDEGRNRTTVCCKPEFEHTPKVGELRKANVKIVPFVMNGNKIDLKATLKQLGVILNLSKILLEGGCDIF